VKGKISSCSFYFVNIRITLERYFKGGFIVLYNKIVLALNDYKYVGSSGNMFYGVNKGGEWVVCVRYRFAISVIRVCKTKSAASFTASVLTKGVQ